MQAERKFRSLVLEMLQDGTSMLCKAHFHLLKKKQLQQVIYTNYMRIRSGTLPVLVTL